jgi:hypothetical protein
MKLGAEPKKIALLGVLLVGVAVSFYVNSGPSVPDGARTSARTAGRPAAPSPVPDIGRSPNVTPRPARTSSSRAVSLQEFKPTMKRKPEDRIDPAQVDPTLRTDLLAKLQSVKAEGGLRSLFDFSEAPPPPVAAKPKKEEIKIIPKPFGPQPPPPPAPVEAKKEPPKPPPTPIPLKFYGYVNPAKAQTDRRAFFLDGEDIIVANEGSTVKGRYKILRIGVNSAEVEDTQQQYKQTLPLEEQAG